MPERWQPVTNISASDEEFTLAQSFSSVCFDQLTGCIRPHWELGTAGTTSRNVNQEKTNLLRTRRELKSETTIAIHCHAYYLDVFCELADAWHSIQNRFLLINTDSEIKAGLIREILRARKESHFVVKVLPNRGRDIAPLLIAWRQELEDFDIVIHCHTKKTPHAERGMGERWRASLIQATFPSKNHAGLIGSMMANNDQNGLVMPWPHQFVAHNVNWGANFAQTQELMRMLGHPVHRYSFLYFPAGSFFWAKTRLLKPLWNMGLRWEDFCKEPTPGDGRLVHALERCIGLLAMRLGLNSYAFWSGGKHHELPGPLDQSILQKLPSHTEIANKEKSFFERGLQLAIESRSNRNESISLGSYS